jgi:hypothetical protein
MTTETTADDPERYYVRPNTKGITGFVVKQAMKRLKLGQPADGAIAIIDSEGVHFAGVGLWNEKEGVPFLLPWDEIDRVVEKKFLGQKGLDFEPKDYAAVVARHPNGQRFAGMGMRYFFLSEKLANNEEVKASIRRFSDVPIATK